MAQQKLFLSTMMLATSTPVRAKTLVGELSNLHNHDVSGTTYILDETSLFIQDFTYDGKAGTVPISPPLLKKKPFK